MSAIWKCYLFFFFIYVLTLNNLWIPSAVKQESTFIIKFETNIRLKSGSISLLKYKKEIIITVDVVCIKYFIG